MQNYSYDIQMNNYFYALNCYKRRNFLSLAHDLSMLKKGPIKSGPNKLLFL